MSITTLSQTFESGTHAAAVNTTNSAGGGAPASGVVTGAGTVTYTSTVGERIDGSLSAKCVGASGETAYVNIASAVASKGGFFVKLRLEDLAAQQPIQVVRGSAKIAQVSLNANGSIRFENSNASQTYTTSVLTLPGVYWLDLAWDTGTSTSDGKLTFALYDSTGALAGGLSAPYEMVGTNAGGGIDSSNLQAGKCNSAATAATIVVDEARAILGAYLLAQTLSAPPTANAGPDQTSVEPGATVTLDGTGSAAVGTVEGYAWTQDPADDVTVTLSSSTAASPTFEAPATLDGVDLHFTLVVTDDLDQDSDPDTVTISVLPVTEATYVDGVLVPVLIYAPSLPALFVLGAATLGSIVLG